jgi:hypothetical protein
MRSKLIFLFSFSLFLSSCAPRISTTISKYYSPLDYSQEVIVYGLQDAIPANSEELATIKIGDTGFSTDCGWNVVIEKASMEARKIGGNAIKITDHIPPSFMGSTCDRITAKVYKVDTSLVVPVEISSENTIIPADYALLHIYRHGGTGALVNYDLHLGDSVICRVSNRWKTTLKIKKNGIYTLWARTEVKEEIPLTLKFGEEYYVRCSISMGALVGRPKIQLIDNQTGRAEFNSIK